MIATATLTQRKTLSSSEIFRLNLSNINIICFQLKPDIEQDEAISLSFHLSRILPHIVVIWDKPYFYALGKFKNSMQEFGIEWESILGQIAGEGIKDFSDRTLQFEEVPLTKTVSANVISLLAYQVLKTSKPYPFSSITALSKNGVQVRREAKFWAEPIEIHGTLQPAITLTIKSKFLSTKTLADFYLNHSEKNNPEKLLIDLNVRSLSGDIQGNGTITQLIKEPSLIDKQKLIEQAKNEISKKALQDELSNKLLVAVKFGKGKKLYKYGMAALRPCVTSETASRFGVNWGELLKETKIPYKKRTELLATYKEEAENALNNYGFELGLSINSRHYPELFWQPQVPIENTPLLFGNGVIGAQSKILTGLSRGGIYRRHNKFSDPSRPIRITVTNLCDVGLDDFIKQLKERLKSYKFESLFVTKSYR
ncbi:MAG: hypothetical protein V7L04_19635 [Nostoc sp.]|uniref:hypothetical protein n=1 Tax=Nostoc sp. TaxID=1180 RepID=UPI002FF4A792